MKLLDQKNRPRPQAKETRMFGIENFRNRSQKKKKGSIGEKRKRRGDRKCSTQTTQKKPKKQLYSTLRGQLGGRGQVLGAEPFKNKKRDELPQGPS